MIRGLIVLAGGLLWCLSATAEAQERTSSEPVADVWREVLGEPAEAAHAAQDAPGVLPAVIAMEAGEIRNIAVDGVTRVAIGDPSIVDVTVMSVNDLLLQAKAVGSTNLILWDRQGQSVSSVEVVDRTPEAVTDQLRQMIGELGLPNVQVTRKDSKIFLTGEVARQEDVQRLDDMLAAFEGRVTNLVSIPVVPIPPAGLPPSVRLTVQLIEITRDATDKLGVDWKDSLTFTETTFGALGPQGVSQVARLGEAFRLGALSRTGLDPILNLLVSTGKARVLAEPKLVAASGKSATTTIGVQVPVITATSVSAGTVTQNIEFKQTGVELRFQPTVLGDERSIQLVIDAKVSSIDKANAITVSGIVVPGFRVRQTQTEIITDSGQTVLIAGLIQDEEKKNFNQLPGVGNIPVLGYLFRSKEFVHGQTELIIMVTPELEEAIPAEVPPETTAEHRTAVLDQAMTFAEIAESVDEPTLRYALRIQQWLAQGIRYPRRESELGISGRVKLRLHVRRDGTLGQALVAEPSGIEAFDLEALKAAERQSPYPPFPPELIQQDLWLELPVLFRP
jgi:pilus assembly protein CpaC